MSVDLHGFDRTAALEPGRCSDASCASLGVSGASIPGSLDERVEIYRNLSADRRVLVVLDNAATEERVAPLVPSSDYLCGHHQQQVPARRA